MAKQKKLIHFQVINKGIVLDFTGEPEGGYTVTVPSLPGCVSYGRTFEQALAMVQDAMAGWLAVAKEEGLLIPESLEKELNGKSNGLHFTA